MPDAIPRPLCAALSELLRYPGAPGRDVALEAERALSLAGPRGAGAEALARFAAASARTAIPDLEELYTATFDLEPACAPYVGHQILGDGPERGPFLAKLAELHGREGFRPTEELGDHVAEVLAFLAMGRACATRDDLLRDGLLPALDRMIAGLEDPRNPYRDLLVAALELLRPAAVAAAPARLEVSR